MIIGAECCGDQRLSKGQPDDQHTQDLDRQHDEIHDAGPMISVPMVRTRSRDLHGTPPKTRPAIGMAMSEPSQMSVDDAALGGVEGVLTVEEVELAGTTISANPTTPIPVARA